MKLLRLLCLDPLWDRFDRWHPVPRVLIALLLTFVALSVLGSRPIFETPAFRVAQAVAIWLVVAKMTRPTEGGD